MTAHTHHGERCEKCEHQHPTAEKVREAAARQAERWAETLRLLGQGAGDET